jgi:hypothetical protein
MLSHALPAALHRISLPRAARLPLRRLPRRCAMTTSAAAVSAPAGVKKDYDELCERLREISALSGVSGLLGWDEQARRCGATARRGVTAVVVTRLLTRLLRPPGDDALWRCRAARSPGRCARRCRL